MAHPRFLRFFTSPIFFFGSTTTIDLKSVINNNIERWKDGFCGWRQSRILGVLVCCDVMWVLNVDFLLSVYNEDYILKNSVKA
ncbi:hypothetical protein HanIR_Chr07g0312401 [Helianthus annuus]|nr:hypothetical protein HanIR_Chr07g0312401 [Helianthus annuus]